MLAELRTLSFQTEFVLAPVEDLAITKGQVRGLFNKLLDEPSGHAYENLDVQAEIPTLFTRRPDGASVCRLGGHRIILEEDHPEVDVEGFIEINRLVLRAIGDDVPPVAVQRVTIECVAAPGRSDDAGDLLLSNMSKVTGEKWPFGRDPIRYGVRFHFAPEIPADGPRERDAGRPGGAKPAGGEAGEAGEDGVEARERTKTEGVVRRPCL